MLQWDLSKTQGGYTIENVATGGFIKADVCDVRSSNFIVLDSLTSCKDKRLVTTDSDRDATMFAISTAGEGLYVVSARESI